MICQETQPGMEQVKFRHSIFLKHVLENMDLRAKYCHRGNETTRVRLVIQLSLKGGNSCIFNCRC